MKQLTKEQRYKEKMTNAGFIRRCIWVHQDDLEKLLKYADKLHKQRSK